MYPSPAPSPAATESPRATTDPTSAGYPALAVGADSRAETGTTDAPVSTVRIRIRVSAARRAFVTTETSIGSRRPPAPSPCTPVPSGCGRAGRPPRRSEVPGGARSDVAPGQVAEHRAVADGPTPTGVGPPEHVRCGVAGRVEAVDQ